MNSIHLQKKKSGNFTTVKYLDTNWDLIATCDTPKELLMAVRGLPSHSIIIKAEYSQSQLKTVSNMYTEKDALKSFGLSRSKESVLKHF